MKYSPAQVAKAIAAAVTALVLVASAVALALGDGVIKPEEWNLIIPLIGNVVLTPLAVFYIPNGGAGDADPTHSSERGGTIADLVLRVLAAIIVGLLVAGLAYWVFVALLQIANGYVVANLVGIFAGIAVLAYWTPLTSRWRA